MKNKIKELTSYEIDLFKSSFSTFVFNQEVDFVYERQIPTAGILLLEGEMTLLKRKKPKLTISPGTMIGLFELFHNLPAKHGLKISKNSRLLIIQKSELMETLKNQMSPIYSILKNAV